MSNGSRAWLLAALQLTCALGACSSESSTGRRASPSAGVGGAGAGGTGASGALPGGACPQLHRTQPCTCSDGERGSQSCEAQLTWSACECAASSGLIVPNFEGNRRTDITFEWERTATSSDLGGCLPGEYEGTFGGLYWSYLATLAPIEDLFVPVANIAIPGEPSGFKFTVMPAEGGETVLRIEGRMDGLADGLFPFNSALEGQLDCTTKTFTANIIGGQYSILADGLLPQSFDGVMWGTYDVKTHTIVSGEWDVRETTGVPPGTLAPMLPREFDRDGFGGYGTWAAALPTDLSDPSLITCPSQGVCGPGPFGPNKLLCGDGFGPPVCAVQADCDSFLPGAGSLCLAAGALSNCFVECKP